MFNLSIHFQIQEGYLKEEKGETLSNIELYREVNRYGKR